MHTPAGKAALSANCFFRDCATDGIRSRTPTHDFGLTPGSAGDIIQPVESAKKRRIGEAMAGNSASKIRSVSWLTPLLLSAGLSACTAMVERPDGSGNGNGNGSTANGSTLGGVGSTPGGDGTTTTDSATCDSLAPIPR